MHDDRINERAGIGAGQHQAHLADQAVNHVLALLLQLVGVDGKRGNISVLHQLAGILAAFCLIERAVGIDAIPAVLQQRMSQHRGGLIVPMVPHERYRLAVAILKGISHDYATVRTAQIVACRPAAKVVSITHFDLYPPLAAFRWRSGRRQVRSPPSLRSRPSKRSDYCCAACPRSDRYWVSCQSPVGFHCWT